MSDDKDKKTGDELIPAEVTESEVAAFITVDGLLTAITTLAKDQIAKGPEGHACACSVVCTLWVPREGGEGVWETGHSRARGIVAVDSELLEEAGRVLKQRAAQTDAPDPKSN